MITYETIRTAGTYHLLQRDDGKRTVVEIANHQVFDMMPGDAPLSGGRYFARATDAGINSVASWYSRSYANRIFRSIASEREGAGQC